MTKGENIKKIFCWQEFIPFFRSREPPFLHFFSVEAEPFTLPEMVTTQVAPDSKSTCGTAVCVVSFNTNLTNLSNRAGLNLQVGGNSIRVSLNTNLSNLTNRAG